MKAHDVILRGSSDTTFPSRRNICKFVTLISIASVAGCQVTQGSRVRAAVMREALIVSGPAFERAQKVFDVVLKSGIAFKRRSIRLVVFDGPLEFPLFISDNEIGLETSAIKRWAKNAQLAALFIVADLQQDFLKSPFNVATFPSDINAEDMGVDLAATGLLAKIGYDPRAIADVGRARADVSEQRIQSIESKLKSMGYQV